MFIYHFHKKFFFQNCWFNGAPHFWILTYHRGHHWRGIKILCNSFTKLSSTSSKNLSIFTKSKNCFWNFMTVQSIHYCSLLLFFLQNLYFAYLFRATTPCRLLEELSKLHSSIIRLIFKIERPAKFAMEGNSQQECN